MATARSYRIDALARGLSVLDTLGSHAGARMTLSEISAETGIDKSRVFRILETLRESDYVARDDDGKTYTLGPRLLSLRTTATGALDITEVALPIMRSLSLSLQDSVSLGVLDGAYVRYIGRVPFRRIISTNIDVGTVLPAHATSMGKLLLAQLDDDTVNDLYGDAPLVALTPKTIVDPTVLVKELAAIRSRGYAVADHELELGLWGLAVPVRGHDGRVLASLSVSSPSARSPKVAAIRPELEQAATEISRALGYDPEAAS